MGDPLLHDNLARAAGFLFIFCLAYTLGFFNGSSSSLPSPAAYSSSDERPLQPPHYNQTDYNPDEQRLGMQCAPALPPSTILPVLMDRAFDGNPPYDGFPPQETAAQILPAKEQPFGWGSDDSVFRKMIERARPRVIIEIGTFLGGSALHMAALTRNLSLPALILCLDDFRGWPTIHREIPSGDLPAYRHGETFLLPQFMANVMAAGEAGRVVPLPFPTTSSLAKLCEWGVYGDLVEVDAGHDFHSAWADVNWGYAVLRPGGLIFGHDYHNPMFDFGVRRAVDLFARLHGLEVQTDGLHWILPPKPEDYTYGT